MFDCINIRAAINNIAGLGWVPLAALSSFRAEDSRYREDGQGVSQEGLRKHKDEFEWQILVEISLKGRKW